MLSDTETSYAQNPQLSRFTVETPAIFFNEIAGFETNSRPYLMKYGAPCSLTSSFDRLLRTGKYAKIVFFVASFLASGSHERSLE